jgi:DNA primase
MLLAYGHERITVPMQAEDGSASEEELSVAELMFQSLAYDDINFEDPLFQAIYRDYSFAHKTGTDVRPARYIGSEQEDWRKLSIDLLTDRYLLSPNWKEKHKIHVVQERDQLLDAVEYAMNVLKERHVDRMLRETQEKLKTAADDGEVEATMRELMRLQDTKVAFAKVTGRQVVG